MQCVEESTFLIPFNLVFVWIGVMEKCMNTCSHGGVEYVTVRIDICTLSCPIYSIFVISSLNSMSSSSMNPVHSKTLSNTTTMLAILTSIDNRLGSLFHRSLTVNTGSVQAAPDIQLLGSVSEQGPPFGIERIPKHTHANIDHN